MLFLFINNIKSYWKWNISSICLNLKARMLSNPHDVLISLRLILDKLPQTIPCSQVSLLFTPDAQNSLSLCPYCLCHHPHPSPSQPPRFWFFLMSLHNIHLQLYQSGTRFSESHWSSDTQERSKGCGLQEHQTHKFSGNQSPSKDIAHIMVKVFTGCVWVFRGLSLCLLSETYWGGLFCPQDGQKP